MYSRVLYRIIVEYCTKDCTTSMIGDFGMPEIIKTSACQVSRATGASTAAYGVRKRPPKSGIFFFDDTARTRKKERQINPTQRAEGSNKETLNKKATQENRGYR